MASLASKFRGCLKGSHVGDCLGAPFELNYRVNPQQVACHLLELADSKTGTSLRDQQYTDDTEMTLCIARSLAEKGTFDPEDITKRFVKEYFTSQPYYRNYGANVRHVFQQLKNTNCRDIYGPSKCQFLNTGSFGNGAAMRTAPIALYCHGKEFEVLKKTATDCALITHAHQHGYNGAILQCLAIEQALSATAAIDPVVFINSLLQKMEILEQSSELDRPFCSRLTWMKEQFENKSYLNIPPSIIGEKLGNGEIAQESLPAALYSFLRGLQPLEDFESDNPFVRTMYFAICCSGDTDTIAAMAGAVAGAYHGEEMVPKEFQARCEGMDESKTLAEKLYDLHYKNTD